MVWPAERSLTVHLVYTPAIQRCLIDIHGSEKIELHAVVRYQTERQADYQYI